MNTTFQLEQATQGNAALELPSELLTQLKAEARASKKTVVALIGEWLQQRELETAQKKEAAELAKIRNEPTRPWRDVRKDLGFK